MGLRDPGLPVALLERGFRGMCADGWLTHSPRQIDARLYLLWSQRWHPGCQQTSSP